MTDVRYSGAKAAPSTLLTRLEGIMQALVAYFLSYHYFNVAGEMDQYKFFPKNPWFNIHLHRWSGAADLEHLHAHPYDFLAITLWGGGIEDIEYGDRVIHRRKVGFIRYYHAPWRHTVKMDPGSWTMIIHGPRWFKYRLWTRALDKPFVPNLNRNKNDGSAPEHDGQA